MEFGTTGRGDGQFHSPYAVAINNITGDIYVLDYANSRVQKFDSTGLYKSQWGSLGNGSGQFCMSLGLASDSAGNIYVSDTQNNRIEKFGP